MTEEKINSLQKELNHIKSLQNVSRDTTNNEPMVTSELKVVDFDKVSKEYGKTFHVNRQPKTNDALYIDENDKWYFIEFKNGDFKTYDIYRKIYDSIIMLVEFGFITFKFCRENMIYILVYNEESYSKKYEKSFQKSDSRSKIHRAIRNKANTERRLYELNKLQGYLFKNTFTYNQEEFHTNFVERYEKIEGI